MRVNVTYEITRNETFALEMRLRDEFGAYEDITNNTIYIEVSDPIPVEDFVVKIGDETGEILITAPSSRTNTWPLGKYLLDIWIFYLVADPLENEHLIRAEITVMARA